VLAFLFAAGSGCDKKEGDAERLQRKMNAEQAQSQRRLDEALSGLEAELAGQEEALRRARDDKLPPENRLDLVTAWDAAMDRVTKQMDEIKAAAEVGRRTGGWVPAHRDRLAAAAERLDRLEKGWTAVGEGWGPEVHKPEKPEPSKK
jgi:chromosome segregation ATPase